MNEILQNRIDEAAEKSVLEEIPPYITSDFVNDCEVECAYERAQEIFIAGANFALQNQWISVGEALPQIREKDIGNRSWSDWVLVMTHGGGAFMDCYAFHRKEWLNNGNDVTHWMSIPSLKGCEK